MSNGHRASRSSCRNLSFRETRPDPLTPNAHIEHADARLSVLTGIIFAAGRGDFVSLTPLARAHARDGTAGDHYVTGTLEQPGTNN